jgi:hypothetical protein
MYNLLTRNGQTIAFGVGLIIAIIMVAIISSGVGEWSLIGENDMARYETSIFNFGMYAAFALMFLAALAALVFGVVQLASSPKGAMKGIIGLVAVVVLFFIIYSAADPDPAMLERMAESEFVVNEGQSKAITGAIWTAIILAGGAIVATAISEIINFFK